MPPTRDAQGCTQGTGGNKGRVISLSWASQHLVLAWWREPRLAEGHRCFPKICWCWQGGHMPTVPASQLPYSYRGACPAEGLALLGHPRTQPGCPLLSGLPFPARDGPGHSRGLQSTPPIQERWELLPWEITQAPSLRWARSAQAQLGPQTHDRSGGGEVAPKLVPGQGGSGAGSRASAGVPSACSCAGSARTASAPAQSPVLGTGGRDRDSGTWGPVPDLSV